MVSIRYFLILGVHVKILQNNQQIKELQAAYENRKRFTISLNGTLGAWDGQHYFIVALPEPSI